MKDLESIWLVASRDVTKKAFVLSLTFDDFVLAYAQALKNRNLF